MIKRKAAKAAAGMIALAVLCLGAANPFDLSNNKSLKDRVQSLEVENAKLQQQVMDLTAKLNVLTQRVNAQCGPGDAGIFNRDDMSASMGSEELPGLEVVRIKREEAVPAPASDPNRGKVFIESASAPDTSGVRELGATIPGSNYVPLPDPALTMNQDPAAADLGSPPSPPVASPPPQTATAPPPAASEPNPTEIAAYDEIKTMVGDGQSEQGRSLMESYLERYPDGAHEDEVAHWLGVILYNQRDFERALSVFKIVSDRHYESASAPESLYHVGLCHLEMGDTKKAGEAFREVKILYPFSKAAQMAESKLASCCP